MPFTDIEIHMQTADAIFRGLASESYPGWFYVCGFLAHVVHLPLGVSAALACSMFNVLCFYAIIYFWKFSCANRNNPSVAVKIKGLAGWGLLLAHFGWGVWYYIQLLRIIIWL